MCVYRNKSGTVSPAQKTFRPRFGIASAARITYHAARHMTYVDFILNLAALLLWLSWCSVGFDPLTKRTPATLMGTLRPAAPKKIQRWHLLAFIAALLLLRSIFYWQIGAALSPIWTGKLDLSVTTLSFRSDWFGRILVFSLLSFGRVLGIFYIGLLFLSLVKGPEPIHRLVRIPLGRVDNWPRGLKFILPFAATAAAWLLSGWLLTALQIAPPPISMAQRLEQAGVIALDSYLIWKFPAVAVLGLHLLSSYIYFGKHPFWNYVNVTAELFLAPLKKIPLRLGKMDFAPLVGIVLIFLAAELAGRGLLWLFQRLPF
jgi:uncharacterized protein YggT (Ycf19 family)